MGEGRWVGKHAPNTVKKETQRKTGRVHTSTGQEDEREKESGRTEKEEKKAERWTNRQTVHLEVEKEINDNREPQPEASSPFPAPTLDLRSAVETSPAPER